MSGPSLILGDKYCDRFGRVWTVNQAWELQSGGDADTWSTIETNRGPLILVADAAPPNYYQFPGGVQVIDITRHLTSNAGQAVQYLARSSRIDGVSKDDPLRDLYKARDMVLDEIARLEAA